MDISVVIPLYNEDESLPELIAWIERVMEANGFSYEIILVDDGSRDGSWAVIEENARRNGCVHGIKFRRNYGKSAALHCGFQAAQGDVVITMDADMQDSPDEIPALYHMIKEEDYDMVSGWKKKRYDPLSKTLPTKLFNATARLFSGIHLHDFNCGLKAYKSKVVKNIEVYGEMHRYIPIIAKQAGFTRIGEKVVQRAEPFHQRDAGFAVHYIHYPFFEETDAPVRGNRNAVVHHRVLLCLVARGGQVDLPLEGDSCPADYGQSFLLHRAGRHDSRHTVVPGRVRGGIGVPFGD